MNFWTLCFFSLVPFHHAAVHQADLTACPDYVQILRWGEEILVRPVCAEQSGSGNESENSVCQNANSLFPEVCEEEREPVVDPYTVRKDSIRQPARLTISENEAVPLAETFSIPTVPSSNVQLAVAEENIPSISPHDSNHTASANTSASPVNESATRAPVRRPWGALTFCVFLLLLSVSANVFLGWQLVETRRMKMK